MSKTISQNKHGFGREAIRRYMCVCLMTSLILRHHESYQMTLNDFMFSSAITNVYIWLNGMLSVAWALYHKPENQNETSYTSAKISRFRLPHTFAVNTGEWRKHSSLCRYFTPPTFLSASISDFPIERPILVDGDSISVGARGCDFNKMPIYLFFASIATLGRLASPFPALRSTSEWAIKYPR